MVRLRTSAEVAMRESPFGNWTFAWGLDGLARLRSKDDAGRGTVSDEPRPAILPQP
jgi:hypothetical protein